jgi:hypothetical protein
MLAVMVAVTTEIIASATWIFPMKTTSATQLPVTVTKIKKAVKLRLFFKMILRIF